MSNAPASSALDPAGPAAAAIADLWWVMFAVCAAVFALVVILLALGLGFGRKSTSPRAPLGDNVFIILGGIAMPAVVLVGLLIYMLAISGKLTPKKADLVIEVNGKMWWWDVYYPASGIRTANELYVPVGKAVRIDLRADEVIHSFWVPSLGGKTDALPGLTNTHWLTADKPGTYRGICAEFCGVQHARMGFYVVALEEAEYRAWEQTRVGTPTARIADSHAEGRRVFMENGCAECHAIRGTQAVGRVGPDLTHMGSRLSIGAATLPNNFGNLAGWISQPQPIKPGNHMPAAYLEPAELRELTRFLTSLK